MKALIINQSQQAGIETTITKPIANELEKQLEMDGLIVVAKVACILNFPQYKNDIERLYAGVDIANKLYKGLLNQGHTNNDIRQIDIHADSNEKTSYGASGFSPSKRGMTFVYNIYKELSAFTPWDDRGCKKTNYYYTLRESDACNAILEISFYDEPIQRTWMKEQKFGIAAAIRNGVYKTFNINPATSYINAIRTITSHGFINTPAYWYYEAPFTQLQSASMTEYFTLLIHRIYNDYNWSDCIDMLTRENIIQSPEYWKNKPMFRPSYMKTVLIGIANNHKF